MVDIVVGPTAVKAGGNVSRVDGIAGETIAQGKAVYLASLTGKYMLADNNHATPEARIPAGLSLNSASLDQPIAVATSGDITVASGAVLTAGTDYYLSGTPGGICPQADVVAGMSVMQLGIARTTTVLGLAIVNPGVSL